MITADLTFDRQALLEKIRAAMKPARFQHVLGVEEAALALADQYGCDPKKASLAALLHDYAKEVEDQVFLNRIHTDFFFQDFCYFVNVFIRIL